MSVILGGGLSGLATGFYLTRNRIVDKIIILEGSDRCGGWIKSTKTPQYLFEQGPRTIRPKGPNAENTLDMISELDLSKYVSIIKHDHPAAKNRMIYTNKKLHSLPSSIWSVFTKNEPFNKPLIYALYHDINSPKETLSDDSLYNFVKRRFGKDIADYAISPMVCGICAGDAKEISVKFLMKSLFEHEQQHGNVVKGMFNSLFKKKTKSKPSLNELTKRSIEEKWSVYTLKNGLQMLPERLEQFLLKKNVNINKNFEVEKIDFLDSNFILITDSSQNVIPGKHIYSAIPAYRLAELLKAQHPKLAENLAAIPYVSVAIVNIFYKDGSLIKNPGFGFLVPPKDKSPILGVIYDSCCLPDQQGTVFTVMLGGRWFKERLGEKPSIHDIIEIAKERLHSILNINVEPDAKNAQILEKCIPQYVVGHYERMTGIRNYIKSHKLPLSLVGASYDGVGVNDVITSAKDAVDELYRQVN